MRRRGGPVTVVMSLVVLLLALLPAGAAARDPEPLPGVGAVSVGPDHTCATWQGGVSCWGDNDSGKLGNGTASGWLSAPIAPPLIEPQSVVVPQAPSTARPFDGLDAGPSATCAIGTGQAGTIAGSLWCWGRPMGRICLGGDLGDGSQPGMVMTGPVTGDGTVLDCGTPLAGVIRSAIGEDRGCALVRPEPRATSGDLWCWGMGDQDAILAHPIVTDAGVAIGGLVDLDRAGDRTCALGADGAVWCWTGATVTPARVGGLEPAVAIAVSADHACAQVQDGSVWCWGNNDAGQLGDGTTTSSAVPVRVIGLDATEPTTITGRDELPDAPRVLGAGDGLTCVLRGLASDAPRAATSAWCWGANNRGQLGDGTTDRRSGPVQVVGLDRTDGLASLGVGGSAACLVTVEPISWSGVDPTVGGALSDQGLRCWGANDRGQLGVGDRNDRSTPTLVVMTEEPRFGN
ncbi:MAG: hypothetical protein U0869_22065 [Chloroflexota bacterium]